MEAKQISVDTLALRLGKNVVDYILNWMRGAPADSIDFHRYRMRLLTSLSDADSVSEKIIILTEKTSPALKFDLMECIGDKVMGEAISKYIFGKVMLCLNDEYRKILDHELDRVKAEINTLNQRTSELKVKIDHH